MRTQNLIGIIIFLSFFLVGKGISQRSIATLTPDDKTKLEHSMAELRWMYIVPMVIIVVLYFLGVRFFSFASHYIFITTCVILCLYVFGITIVLYRKLQHRNLPAAYIRGFLLSRIITFIGMVLLIGFLLFYGE